MIFFFSLKCQKRNSQEWSQIASVWTIWEECQVFWRCKEERKSTWTLYLRAHLSRGRVLLNRCTEKIKWSPCQSITAPGRICPKHTSFAKGLCECMKGKSEVTTCRVRTLWLPSLKLKATLKTDRGKGIKRIHFWPALHSALFPEQITSPLLCASAEDGRWSEGALGNSWGLFCTNTCCVSFLSKVWRSRSISTKKLANCQAAPRLEPMPREVG